MPKKGKPPVDPLKTIATSGFIGYVAEEEETHGTDEPGVVWVDIALIHDNPFQHAETINPDHFQALVEAIKVDGFQGALNVSPLPEPEGHYFLTGGGHQRRDAAREAGLTKLPVFVSETAPDRITLALRAARENTARVNVSILNLGHLYEHMINEFGVTQEEIAQAVQKDRNHVKFALMAVRSPADIQNMLQEKPESLRAMVYFRRLEREEDRKPIMDQFVAGELSTEGVRQAVEAVLGRLREESQDIPSKTGQTQTEEKQLALSAPVHEEIVVRPVEEPTSSTPAPSTPSPAPVEPVVSPSSRPIDAVHLRPEEVPQEMSARKQTGGAGFFVAQETQDQTRERLRQIYTILQLLQTYKRQVSTPGQLVEEELRALGEINSVTQQLLDQEET